MQPYSFLVGCLCLLYYGRLSKFFIIYLLPVIGLVISIIFFDPPNLKDISRVIVIYCSPFILSHVVFFSLRSGEKFSITSNELIPIAHRKFIQIALITVWINFFVGALQLLISNNLFNILVIARTSLERGVTGLTPEPSMYGLNLIALGALIYCLDIKKKQKNKYLFILAIQLIFFSQSALAIGTALIICLIYISKNKLQSFAAITVAFLIFLFLVENINFENSNIRLFNIIKTFISDPSNILYADGSISERFYHVILSFYGLGFPQGFSSFAKLIANAKLIFPTYWWGDPTNKVMSGIGAAFWEIGIFSLPLMILPFRLAIIALGGFSGFLIGISLILIFIQSVNYGLPLYSIICGYLAYIIDVRRRCNSIKKRTDALIVCAEPIHSRQ